MAEVIAFNPGEFVGDGHVVTPENVLETAKGQLATVTVIGWAHDGTLYVAGSHGAADSAFLMACGQAFLVKNEVVRS